jgi:hypothetical protein
MNGGMASYPRDKEKEADDEDSIRKIGILERIPDAVNEDKERAERTGLARDVQSMINKAAVSRGRIGHPSQQPIGAIEDKGQFRKYYDDRN